VACICLERVEIPLNGGLPRRVGLAWCKLDGCGGIVAVQDSGYHQYLLIRGHVHVELLLKFQCV
jgi:hypothetical protein